MSFSYGITLAQEIPGLNAVIDATSAAAASKVLEELAGTAGVRTLMSFYKNAAEETADTPARRYHDAVEGLRTVRALIEGVRKSPGLVENPGWVVTDLREFERVLAKAAETGVCWRLSLDY